MNSIGWFVYLAGVADNLGVLLASVLIFTAIAWSILNVAVPITEGEVLNWSDYRKWWTRGLVVLIGCGFLFALIPSKNTMYAVAAAQIGETVAKSEAVQGIASDATKALQSWVKRQIEPETKK